jgi:rubredoxin-NAD+ reductase
LNKLVIIGSGLGGYTLAREFRKLDKTVELTIVTREDGTFYSKPLLSNALTADKSAAQLATASADAMAEQLDARILPHQSVASIDSDNHVLHLESGDSLSYDKLVLAAGAHQNRLALHGDAADQLVTINNLADYHHFRERLVHARSIAIIGAGLIGCEFANDLLSRALEIHVVARGSAPMDTLLPVELGRELQSRLAERGIIWHTECTAVGLNRRPDGLQLALSAASTLDVDLVLSATGLHPNIQLARDGGLATNRGILVNALLETSVPDIYAVGDCAEYNNRVLPYVMPLMNQARALAKTLAGNPTPLVYPVMPVVVKTPVLPLTICPPPADSHGDWQLEKTAECFVALFRDPHGNLTGFALGGDGNKQKASLVKQLTVATQP